MVTSWLRWAPLAALLSIVACSQPTGLANQAASAPSSNNLSAPIDSHYGYNWLLVVPPQRAYAADRSYFAGGPLATAPMEGQEFHGAYTTSTVTQLDTGAPLSRWQKLGFFHRNRTVMLPRRSSLSRLLTQPG